MRDKVRDSCTPACLASRSQGMLRACFVYSARVSRDSVPCPCICYRRIPRIPAGRGVWGHGPEVVYDGYCVSGNDQMPGRCCAQWHPSRHTDRTGMDSMVYPAGMLPSLYLNLRGLLPNCRPCSAFAVLRYIPGFQETRINQIQRFLLLSGILIKTSLTSIGIPLTFQALCLLGIPRKRSCAETVFVAKNTEVFAPLGSRGWSWYSHASQEFVDFFSGRRL